jgi:hypothetical protein
LVTYGIGTTVNSDLEFQYEHKVDTIINPTESVYIFGLWESDGNQWSSSTNLAYQYNAIRSDFNAIFENWYSSTNSICKIRYEEPNFKFKILLPASSTTGQVSCYVNFVDLEGRFPAQNLEIQTRKCPDLSIIQANVDTNFRTEI